MCKDSKVDQYKTRAERGFAFIYRVKRGLKDRVHRKFHSTLCFPSKYTLHIIHELVKNVYQATNYRCVT